MVDVIIVCWDQVVNSQHVGGNRMDLDVVEDHLLKEKGLVD